MGCPIYGGALTNLQTFLCPALVRCVTVNTYSTIRCEQVPYVCRGVGLHMCLDTGQIFKKKSVCL